MPHPKVFVTRRIPAQGLDLIRAFCDADLWPEDLPPDHPLLELENCLIVPHTAPANAPVTQWRGWPRKTSRVARDAPIVSTRKFTIANRNMAKFVPAPEKIKQARALIQKARDLPVPADGGRWSFSYVAEVRAYLEKARDLVKFIPRTPSATAELKADVQKIFEEADLAHKEILR